MFFVGKGVVTQLSQRREALATPASQPGWSSLFGVRIWTCGLISRKRFGFEHSKQVVGGQPELLYWLAESKGKRRGP